MKCIPSRSDHIDEKENHWECFKIDLWNSRIFVHGLNSQLFRHFIECQIQFETTDLCSVQYRKLFGIIRRGCHLFIDFEAAFSWRHRGHSINKISITNQLSTQKVISMSHWMNGMDTMPWNVQTNETWKLYNPE